MTRRLNDGFRWPVDHLTDRVDTPYDGPNYYRADEDTTPTRRARAVALLVTLALGYWGLVLYVSLDTRDLSTSLAVMAGVPVLAVLALLAYGVTQGDRR